ncbi:transcription factor S-II-domain-containing protein [Gongronella butleri]|nr:transcription factor S-II-domain-containing protein [Gongronella butleri]
MDQRNVIGSLMFCDECGNLLDMPGDTEDIIRCQLCGFGHQLENTNPIEVITASSERAFQSALKAKRQLVQNNTHQPEAEAMVDEKCPQCGHHEMAYHTMQLRSADEGQTVFYNCKKCGYKFSVNS